MDFVLPNSISHSSTQTKTQSFEIPTESILPRQFLLNHS
ncbi:hypothetical protein AM1_H0013 (plasmid) [Acaryochloris marina MBIC11017]|uniref:Uncharacterized protein n=1 Tax=Acaryochloris marina (strain MBIC 11017) TaxID=329726 RepID=A8ZQT0_ACAM1|nr:hypothetical protein AM1_H0013 [Acaryochloris marina MBIC11017]